MGKTIIETQRLIIRELERTDAPFVFPLVNTEGWLRYVGDRNVYSVEDAERYLERGPLASYEANGFGLWLVIEKSTQLPLGICGLIRRPALDDLDIGFAFMPEYYGKGYASEAAAACVEVARSRDISRIVAITLPENKPSIRLLEKLGFMFQQTTSLPPSSTVLNLYALNIKS